MWCIVVAGGSGTRFGAAKQYVELDGAPVLHHSVAVAADAVDGVVVVLPPADLGMVVPRAAAVVAGGATRSASVRAGLAAVPADAQIVLVHDAARPNASPGLFRAVIAAVEAGADAAVPAVPVSDTIRHRDGGVVDRSQLVAVQTPQAFRADALRRAHAAEADATDDAGLVEAAGGRVVIVPGERSNLKLTEPADLVVLQALRAERAGSARMEP